MTASQFRAEARKKLATKWGKAGLLTLVFAITIYIISLILHFIPMIGSLIFSIITIPLSYGFTISMLKLNDDKEVSYFDFFSNGLSNFGKAWGITLNIVSKLILPILFIALCIGIIIYATFLQNAILTTLGFILYLATIVYAIIKILSYKLALLVLYDNPDMNVTEAVEKSAELMKGNIGALFCLILSFIGWAFLSIFTLGIGFIWLIPYIRITEIAFYRNLNGEISK